jgi:hypothetical protein
MAKGFRTELRQAFLEAGTLVFGGIAGAGAAYLVFGESWIFQGVFAIGGAWLTRHLVCRAGSNCDSKGQ